MSPNVGNFVHDLVEMAKAMETLPQVQAELEAQNKINMELYKTVQSREEAILRYKAEIEELQSKVRATEAERDNAELRFLELDGKASRVLHWLEDVESSAKNIRQLVEPPKPQLEPEPVPQPIPEVVQSIEAQPQGQGESPFEPSQNAAGSDTTKTAQTGEGSSPPSQPPTNQDQSEVNPTANTGLVDTVANSQPAQSMDVGSTSTETSPIEPKPSGLYTGKSYSSHPVYVSYWDWIEGGGTEESYRR